MFDHALTDPDLSSVFSAPGSSVGAADEGAEAGGEAEEGPGATVQPAPHRVQPDAI